MADVARILMSLDGTSPAPSEQYAGSSADTPAAPAVQASREPEFRSRGWLSVLFQGLAEAVGFVFGATAPVERPTRQQNAMSSVNQGAGASALGRSESHDAVINLGKIWTETSLRSADEVLQCLAELDKQRAIAIQRRISFAPRGLSLQSEPALETLFKAVEAAGKAVLRHLSRKGQWVFDFDSLSQDLGHLSVPDAYRPDYQKAFKRALVYLLKASGARVRQTVAQGGAVQLETRLSRSARTSANLRLKSLVKTGKSVWSVFEPRVPAAEKNVPVAALIRAAQAGSPGKSFREADLRRALGFLAALQLVSVSEPMVPMSYVLEVLRPEEPLHEPEHPEVWAELHGVNRFAEIRGLAMEVFVHLPHEARAEFIEGYFQQKTAQEMEAFLDAQLGEIEDEPDEAGEQGNRSFIASKREELRATAVEEFFQCYTEAPEEPNQWKAISHPFDRHLLVNAGPGSGKTAVLLARVAHLLRVQQLRPDEILVLSFNRAVVFEIRTRIRELFGRLGYAAYVRRLNIHTFHAFALRHLPRREDGATWLERRDSSIYELADLLKHDPAFRTRVAGGLRAILVDEFQDVNDDIYRILALLSAAGDSSCGLMVIGDDDQDILRWHRGGREFSEMYFSRFQRDFAKREDERLILRVNFRSGPEIVEHSQRFLSDFFEEIRGASVRLKEEDLRPRMEAGESRVHAMNGIQTYRDALIDAARIVEKIPSLSEQGTLAILCRTNAEVADTYLHLRRVWPGLSVQAVSKHRIVSLRNIGLWRDQLEEQLQRVGDQGLSDALERGLLEKYNALDIPEVRRPREEDFSPQEIIKLVRRENHYPRLSHLMDFLEGQDVDELERLRGAFVEGKGYAVVSSIHKVKGLEFDRVLILPSNAHFGERGDSVDAIRRDASEEARLYYVGMTRAKRYLRYYEGHRESAWKRCLPINGEVGQRRILEGNPGEVWLGWSWQKSPYNTDPDGCQKYIESAVRVGDRLKLGGVGSGSGKGLLHIDSNGGSRQVGFLAKSVGGGGSVNDLIVSAVIRYRYDSEKEMNPASVASTVEERGWGYLVLAAGALR
ncbi:MAG: ATP-dependent helicase [Opitutales bacterium]